MAINLTDEYDCQFIFGIKYWTFFQIYSYNLAEICSYYLIEKEIKQYDFIFYRFNEFKNKNKLSYKSYIKNYTVLFDRFKKICEKENAFFDQATANRQFNLLRSK